MLLTRVNSVEDHFILRCMEKVIVTIQHENQVLKKRKKKGQVFKKKNKFLIVCLYVEYSKATVERKALWAK